MPPAAAAVIGGIVAGASAYAAGAAILTSVLIGVGSLALGFAQQLLAPHPKQPELPSFPTLLGPERTTLLKQAVINRKIPFGEVIISGGLTFYESTENNRYHHMVVTLGDAPQEPWDGIEIVFINNEPIFESQMDVDGNVTKGKFANKLRIRKHLGGPDQVADSALISEIGRLDSNFRGRGIAYLYLRVDWDQDVFQGGLPNDIRALCRTNAVLDSRGDYEERRYSPNAALALAEYCREDTVGLGYATSDISQTYLDAAANVCDEIVDCKPVGHAVIAVDTTENEVTLYNGGSLSPLRFETGDRLLIQSSGTIPGGLPSECYAIVTRLVGQSYDDDTTVTLSAGSYSGDVAAAITAGNVDTTKSSSADVDFVHPAISFADSYENALLRIKLDITSAGTGQIVIVKNGEPRYAMSGVVDTSRNPQDNLEDMLSAMASRFVWTGGVFRIFAGAYSSPVLSLDESDLLGPMINRTKHSRSERFNCVKGLFATHLSLGETTDYPSVVDLTYVDADGGDKIYSSIDKPFTSRSSTAQRLAKIDLSRHRREKQIEYPTTMKALQAPPGSVVEVSNTRRGWVNKTFEVADAEDYYVGDNDPKVQGVKLLLLETDAAVYQFDPDTDEVIKAPSYTPPGGRPGLPANPTALLLSTSTYVSENGTLLYRLQIDWTEPADFYVINGGQIEIQWKRSADSAWNPSFFVAGVLDTTFVPANVQFGVNHDIRIRSVNAFGARAATWQQILAYTVGAPGEGASATADDGHFSGDPGTSTADDGGFAETAIATYDDGNFV